MTNIYVARPPAPRPPTPHRGYSLDAEAKALMMKGTDIVKPLTYDPPGKGRYVTDGGYEFNVELNILDTATKLPIRAVDIKSGEHKTFTDRIGRAVLRLPRGRNEVLIEGLGYLEKESFAPEATRFEPILLTLDLDSDSIFTIYSSGQVIPGERKILNNPGNNPGDLQEWLRQYWWVLGLAGVAGVTFYYIGKSKTPSA